MEVRATWPRSWTVRVVSWLQAPQPVDRAQYGLQRCREYRIIEADAPPDPVRAAGLDVGRGRGVGASGDGVLGVVNDLDVNGQVLLQRVDKGGDGSVARARHRHGL